MSFDATGEVPRFCPQCGAPAEGGRFCARCGASLTGEPAPPRPTAPPPNEPVLAVPPPVEPPLGSPRAGDGPSTPWWRSPVGLTLAAVAAVALVAVAVLFLGGDDSTTSPSTILQPVTAPSLVPTVPATILPPATFPPTTLAVTSTLAPTTTAPITTTTVPPDPASVYVGLERDPTELPPGLVESGGSLLPGDQHVVTWVTRPEGDMLWLELVTAVGPGGVEQLVVLDAVSLPPVDLSTDVVITGAAPCEVDGAPAEGVVGAFAFRGEEWLVDPFAVWRADLVAGRFVPLDPAATRCLDEGAFS